MKDVQCYELFGGIALKNHAFSFAFSSGKGSDVVIMSRGRYIAEAYRQLSDTDVQKQVSQ